MASDVAKGFIRSTWIYKSVPTRWQSRDNGLIQFASVVHATIESIENQARPLLSSALQNVGQRSGL